MDYIKENEKTMCQDCKDGGFTISPCPHWDAKTVETWDSLEEKRLALPEGESLVGVVQVERGFYLIIGDKYTSNRWAVTITELQELYRILRRRFDLTVTPEENITGVISGITSSFQKSE